MTVLVRLFGACLLVAALGACTSAEDSGIKAGIIMVVSGAACISVREGVPRLRLAVAAALIPLSLAIVDRGQVADRAAVAVIVVAVMALRKEPFCCSRCDVEEPGKGRYCANCGATRA